MKPLVSIFLFTLIAITAIRDMIVIFSFNANQENIIANHCVNKDKPEMECHGKCFLSTQLNKEKKQENNYPVSNFENKLQPIFYTVSNIYTPEVNQQNSDYIQFVQPEKRPSDGYLSGVFRPPQFLINFN